MKDLNEKYTVDYLAKFDVVTAHAYEKFIERDKDANLSNFKAIKYFNEAKNYALALSRLDVLEDMYEIIQRRENGRIGTDARRF